jgi:hypothetical protein
MEVFGCSSSLLISTRLLCQTAIVYFPFQRLLYFSVVYSSPEQNKVEKCNMFHHLKNVVFINCS